VTSEAFTTLRAPGQCRALARDDLRAPAGAPRSATATCRCAPAAKMPPGIDGTSPQWAEWVERRHATPPLTPRVRATVRTIMAKAGRWLAARAPADHPGRDSGPGKPAPPGSRRRPDGGRRLHPAARPHPGRAGKPISPRTKSHVLMATRMFFRDCQEWEWLPAVPCFLCP
jgi:hypothetical protein